MTNILGAVSGRKAGAESAGEAAARRAIDVAQKVGQAAANAAIGAAQKLGLAQADGVQVCAVALLRAGVDFSRAAGVAHEQVRAVVDAAAGRSDQNLRRALGENAIRVLRETIVAIESIAFAEIERVDDGLLARGRAILAEVAEMDGEPAPEKKASEPAPGRDDGLDVCGARNGLGQVCTLPDGHRSGDGGPTDHADGSITWGWLR